MKESYRSAIRSVFDLNDLPDLQPIFPPLYSHLAITSNEYERLKDGRTRSERLHKLFEILGRKADDVVSILIQCLLQGGFEVLADNLKHQIETFDADSIAVKRDDEVEELKKSGELPFKFSVNQATLRFILERLTDMNKLNTVDCRDFYSLPNTEKLDNVFREFCHCLHRRSPDLLDKYYPDFLHEMQEHEMQEQAIDIRKWRKGVKTDLVQIEGTTILDEQLGEGTYGEVYLGFRDRLIAIKVARESSDITKRTLENEIAILSGRSNGYTYFTMEYVSGTRIDLFMMGNVRSLKEKLYLGAQAWTGLGHLHANNIYHHDISPGNVLVNVLKVVKICDFGCSETKKKLQTTESLNKRGKGLYNAPELYLTGDRHSGATDVWSMGVTLFCCYYDGTYPFTNDGKYRNGMEEILGTYYAKPDLSKIPIVQEFEQKVPDLGAVTLPPLKWEYEEREPALVLAEKTGQLRDRL